MKIFSNKLDFNSLKKKHFSYINDSSYVSEEDRGKQISKLFYVFIMFYGLLGKKVISKIDIFTPQSIAVVLWNILMFIVLISQVFAIPLKISYELSFDENISNAFLI